MDDKWNTSGYWEVVLNLRSFSNTCCDGYGPVLVNVALHPKVDRSRVHGSVLLPDLEMLFDLSEGLSLAKVRFRLFRHWP